MASSLPPSVPPAWLQPLNREGRVGASLGGGAGSPMVLGGGGRVLPVAPGARVAILTRAGQCLAAAGHGSAWQPPRQRVGTGAPAGPWCARHSSFGARHTQPRSHRWQFPPQRMGGPDLVPCFASLPPPRAAGGLWDGLGTEMGMGTKGLGAWGHAPGGQEGVPAQESRVLPLCLLLSHRHWGAGGTGGTVPLSRVLDWSPCPHTAPVPTAAHTGTHGSNTQPR